MYQPCDRQAQKTQKAAILQNWEILEENSYNKCCKMYII